MKRLFIVPLLAFVLCSCAPTNRRHLGTWEATGMRDYYVIAKISDKAIEITTPDKTYSSEYMIDYTKTPMWLDMAWDKKMVRCIMEFIDKDSFRIIGENEADKPRPSAFEPAKDVVLFQRMEKKK